MATLLDERTITLELSDLRERVPISRPSQPPTRSPGWHESDLLRDVALEYGWLKRGSVEDQESLPGDYPWRWALGQAWEEFWFSFQGPETGTVWQPGERVVDGIAVNADGLTITPHSLCPWVQAVGGDGRAQWLEETKHTEKRVRTGAEFMTEKLWLHQGRAYCYCYLPDAATLGGVVRWTIQFYRGDYKGSGPVCKQYTVGFSAGEVTGTWGLLTERKLLLEARGVSPPAQR